MKLYFSWRWNSGELVPVCRLEAGYRDNASPLCCLLTDDGGQRLLDTLPWLDQGIERVRLAKGTRPVNADWSRDAWGAQLSQSSVKIYSLYDEKYCEVMDIEKFEVILTKWRNFIQLPPHEDIRQEFKV